MIGQLVGKVVTEELDGAVLLDVGGVGYELTVPLGALSRAKGSRAQTTLVVHTHVREDALALFGFASPHERAVFRLLLGLPGVGPKLAISILSSLPPEELALAVGRNDLRRLNRVPGVGKKTAERLILELKERLPRLGAVASDAAPQGTPALDDGQRLEGALTNMGYKLPQAKKAVEGLGDRVGAEPIASLLRAALAELSS